MNNTKQKLRSRGSFLVFDVNTTNYPLITPSLTEMLQDTVLGMRDDIKWMSFYLKQKSCTLVFEKYISLGEKLSDLRSSLQDAMSLSVSSSANDHYDDGYGNNQVNFEKSLEFDHSINIAASLDIEMRRQKEMTSSPFSANRVPFGGISISEVVECVADTVNFIKSNWPREMIEEADCHVYDYQTADFFLTPKAQLEFLREMGLISLQVSRNNVMAMTVQDYLRPPIFGLRREMRSSIGTLYRAILGAISAQFWATHLHTRDNEVKLEEALGKIIGVLEEIDDNQINK